MLFYCICSAIILACAVVFLCMKHFFKTSIVAIVNFQATLVCLILQFPKYLLDYSNFAYAKICDQMLPQLIADCWYLIYLAIFSC